MWIDRSRRRERVCSDEPEEEEQGQHCQRCDAAREGMAFPKLKREGLAFFPKLKRGYGLPQAQARLSISAQGYALA